MCRYLFGISPISAETIKNNDLVNIQELDSTILVDLKYTTTDNFMNMDMYGNLETCYLRKNPAEMLLRANEYLKETNPELKLLIYDGLRPRSIQRKLWNALDEVPETERTQYVADPEKGSIHNYGAAVDLTLAHKNGAPLDMGTKYDHFGELAFPALEDSLFSIGVLTLAQIENRKILRNVMTKAGFSTISSEWWHFNAYSYQDIQTKYNIIE
ncbi:MAG: M15 family metallopeptidase [Candidatus Neomarinimicrobiota bacterium]|nr:M15 family metallopeptidase [Candidatus Neomarinimicrobiota bacterium]